MTDDTDKTIHTGDDDASLEKLLKLAGERPEIPLSIESRVYNRVQQEWRNSSVQTTGDKAYDEVHKSWRRSARRKNLLRWLVPVGVAATAAIAVFVSTQPEVLPPPVAATVSRVIDAGQGDARYSKGSVIRVGESVSTAINEGLSLLLARGESLRIDENTALRIDGTDQFTLLSGRVYADTGLYIYRQGGLVIDTALGTVTDVGTQFSVAATDGVLEVAVREGRVDVRNEAETYAARMGDRLTLRSGRGVETGRLDAHDDYWSWVAELAPTFDISNQSLLDFLKWAARETGRELQFDSDETRMQAMGLIFPDSVSIEGLTPDEALASILSTTAVRYRIDSDKVFIEKR